MKIIQDLLGSLFGSKAKPNAPAPKTAPNAPAPKPATKSAGVSQPPALPEQAEKSVENGQLVIARLPAYDPARDSAYMYSHLTAQEKEILKQVTKVVVGKNEFFMLTQDGERAYAVPYTEIGSLYHQQRAAPVHIFGLKGGTLRDRIPFPSWTRKFNPEIIAAIASHAGLEEKKYSQSFRDETVETSYYGRK